MTLQRRIDAVPAAADADPDDSVLCRWVLRGTRGATSLVAYRYPAGSPAAAAARGLPGVYQFDGDGDAWVAADLGYHAPRPMFDDHRPQVTCDVFGGGACYSDGSVVQARTLLGEWIAADCDEEVIWAVLACEYWARFDTGSEALRDALESLQGGHPAAVDEAVAALGGPPEPH